MKNKVELLAPAGNWDSLRAAINNGANAVYLGLDDFNARGNIENFTIENLKEVVSFAHFFDVKVYITLNILIKDNEFKEVLNLVRKALEYKTDAFIIQDLGLAYLLKEKFPNIELHASTQMGIENLEGALFAKRIGFKRVVLARETPLAETKRITENCDIDIEYFIQGALCVAFSGNCYLCSLLANSSGNRGKCKQFCRLPYKIERNAFHKEGYLLSTKDFCMAPKLKEMVDVGVSSLKIEGRARRPGYVGQVVETYRHILDNNFNYSNNDITNIKKVFNRGNYIQGYFNNEKIIYSEAQNHIGIEIGKVVKFNKGKKFNEIIIQSDFIINKNDVLKFMFDDKENGVITVKDIYHLSKNLYKITTTALIKNNSIVRLIVDSEQEKYILSKKKTLKVEANFKAKIGEKAELILKVDDNIVNVFSDFIVEEAKSSPLTIDECKKQISKLGEDFILTKCNCDIDNVFIAKSQLNSLRRDAVELLNNKIIKSYEEKHNLNDLSKEKNFEDNLIKNTEKTRKNMIIFNNFDNFNEIKDKYDKFIYQPNEYNIEQIEANYKEYSNYNIYFSFPILVNYAELEKIKSILKITPNWGVYANNYYALDLVSKEKTIIGSNMNVYNSLSVLYYSKLGFKNIVLSIENVDLDNICNYDVRLYKMSKYYPEYMYFRHCPIKENVGGDCSNCQYKEGFTYKLNGKTFNIVRRRLLTCQFVLKSANLIEEKVSNKFSICEEYK